MPENSLLVNKLSSVIVSVTLNSRFTVVYRQLFYGYCVA